MASPLHTRPHGGPTSLSVCPHFKGLARNFVCALLSGPFYDVLVSIIFASSPVSFTFFQLPSLVSGAGTSGPGICPLPVVQALYKLPTHPSGVPQCSHKSCTQFALGGSPLPFRKGVAINLPLLCKVSAVSRTPSPDQGLWGVCSAIFQGTSALPLIT